MNDDDNRWTPEAQSGLAILVLYREYLELIDTPRFESLDKYVAWRVTSAMFGELDEDKRILMYEGVQLIKNVPGIELGVVAMSLPKEKLDEFIDDYLKYKDDEDEQAYQDLLDREVG